MDAWTLEMPSAMRNRIGGMLYVFRCETAQSLVWKSLALEPSHSDYVRDL